MAKSNDNENMQIMVGSSGEPMALISLRSLLELLQALRVTLERTKNVELSRAAEKELQRARDSLAHVAEDTAQAREAISALFPNVTKLLDQYRETIAGSSDPRWSVPVTKVGGFEENLDLAAFRAAKAKDEETVPLALLDRLVAGDHPIKVYRKHRGLTQKELAERVGVSPLYISQIETGKRDGSMKLLRRLADALDVNLADLAA